MKQRYQDAALIYFKILAMIACAIAPVEAFAASTGLITSTATLDNGVFMVWIGGADSSPIACNTVHRYAINAATLAGQAQMSVLLSAAVAHKTVTILGTGTCDVWGDSETVSVIYLQP